jgi:hypothetical protein
MVVYIHCPKLTLLSVLYISFSAYMIATFAGDIIEGLSSIWEINGNKKDKQRE